MGNAATSKKGDSAENGKQMSNLFTFLVYFELTWKITLFVKDLERPNWLNFQMEEVVDINHS